MFPDNHVVIKHGRDVFPVEAVVEEIDGFDIHVSIKRDRVDDLARLGSSLKNVDRVGMVPVLAGTPERREEVTVNKVRESGLGKVLTGERGIRFEGSSGTRMDDDLNQEQLEAVRYSMLAEDMFVLHGPPGTGKTRALIEIVRRAVSMDQKVLVAADSNQAVDNILVGGSREGVPDESSLHRYGQHERQEFVVKRENASKSKNGLVKELYRNADEKPDVVCSTNNSSFELSSRYDLAVVDEATQSSLTSSLIPVSKADSFVLAGDHRQLPPYSAGEKPPGKYGRSLFEHLYGDDGVYKNVGVKLKTQYRMHPEIMQFPNQEFYNHQLRAGEQKELLEGRENAVEGYNLGGEVETRDRSPYNLNEVSMIENLVDELIGQNNVNPEDIGVISPYSSQVYRIEEKIDQDITVDTIDSFQGSERTVILVSFVRSNPSGDIGFLGRPEDGPRRLNVAMTRAKKLLVMVGDFHSLRYKQEDKCSQVYQNLYSFLKKRSMSDIPSDFLD